MAPRVGALRRKLLSIDGVPACLSAANFIWGTALSGSGQADDFGTSYTGCSSGRGVILSDAVDVLSPVSTFFITAFCQKSPNFGALL